MTEYREIVIETYDNLGEPSAESIRARPIFGQDLDPSMKVECSSKMRENHKIGTKFLIQAKVTNRECGTSFLYSHYSWPYKVLTDKEANAFIKQQKSRSTLI